MKKLRLVSLLTIVFSVLLTSCSATDLRRGAIGRAEVWEKQEFTFKASIDTSNPFTDVSFGAIFESGENKLDVKGFYDGNDVWKIRFMPPSVGSWEMTTYSSHSSIDGKKINFTVAPNTSSNHGPVNVEHRFHFSHADGTPFFVLGTTAYNWLNRSSELQDETLSSLKNSPFNKLRFGLFPKWFVFNRVEPASYPYEKNADGSFNFNRFNPRFFDLIESRIEQLKGLKIQADIILFHPYDKWGFATMTESQNKAWIDYVVARLSAYSNVWWTMANEYDVMTARNWETLVDKLSEADPYNHLLGNHPIADWYAPSNPKITHVIQQSGTTAKQSLELARYTYGKPVLNDEYGYEGNNTMGWGDLGSQDAVLRHWEITLAGGYASHGDTHVHPGGIQFWAAGGTFYGESPQRLGFLRKVMESLPFQEMSPNSEVVVDGDALAKKGEAYLFSFFKVEKLLEPRLKPQVRLQGAKCFDVHLIEPWTMEEFYLGQTSSGDQAFSLLVRPSLLKVTRTEAGQVCEAKSIQTLLNKFTGEPDEDGEFKAELLPEKFASNLLHYSLDYPIAQLMLNPRVKEILENTLPAETFEIPNRAFPLRYLIENGRIDKKYIEILSTLNKRISAIQFCHYKEKFQDSTKVNIN